LTDGVDIPTLAVAAKDSTGYDADKTAAAKAIADDKGAWGTKTVTVDSLTATCAFFSVSDFTTV
jgi:hypothetical protein